MNAAFSSDECNLLEQALDVAWDIVLHSGKLDAFRLETAKAALTRAILTSYESGERNVRRRRRQGNRWRCRDHAPTTVNVTVAV